MFLTCEGLAMGAAAGFTDAESSNIYSRSHIFTV